MRLTDDNSVVKVRAEQIEPSVDAKARLDGGPDDAPSRSIFRRRGADPEPAPVAAPESPGDGARLDGDVVDGAEGPFPGLRPDERVRLHGSLTGIGVNPEVADRIVAQMDKLTSKYGVRYGGVGSLDKSDPWLANASAVVQTNGYMGFDPDQLNLDTKSQMNDGLRNGWLTTGTVEGLVSHETTHLMQHGFTELGAARFQYSFKKAENHVIDTFYGGSRARYVQGRNTMGRYLALDDNGVEMQAEMFAAMQHPNENLRPAWFQSFSEVFDETYANNDLTFTSYATKGPNTPARDEFGEQILPEFDQDEDDNVVIELPPFLELKKDFPVVDQTPDGRNIVEVTTRWGDKVPAGEKIAPLVDFLSKNKIDAIRGTDGDPYNPQLRDGWAPATLTFATDEDFNRFIEESGLDVEFNGQGSDQAFLQDSPPSSNSVRAVGHPGMRQVRFNPRQIQTIASRIHNTNHGFPADGNSPANPVPTGAARSTPEYDFEPEEEGSEVWDEATQSWVPDTGNAPAIAIPDELLKYDGAQVMAGRAEADGWTLVFKSSDADSFDSNPSGGVNDSNFIEKDGQRFFVKDTANNGEAGALTEQDASNLLRALGHPAPLTVAGADGSGLVVGDLAGREQGIEIQGSFMDAFGDYADDSQMNLADPKQLLTISMADLAMNNQDRHGGNLLIGRDENGKNVLFPIDHELSMDGFIPQPDGSDLEWALEDINLSALESPLRSYLGGRDVNEVYAEVGAELDKIEAALDTFEWRNESNKKNVKGRITAMRADIQAVVMKLGLEEEQPTGPIENFVQDEDNEDILPPTDDEADLDPDLDTPGRPSDYADELLTMDTFDVVTNNIDGWRARGGFSKGINDSNILVSDDGRVAFVKQTGTPEEAASEVDASQFLRDLGLNSPYISNGGDDERLVVASMAGHEDGLTDVDTLEGIFGGVHPTMDDLELADEDSLLNLALADIALGSSDRHHGNLMFGRDANDQGVFIAIDNGFSLDTAGSDPPDTDGSGTEDLLGGVHISAYEQMLDKYAREMGPEALAEKISERIAQMEETARLMAWASPANENQMTARLAAMKADQEGILRHITTYRERMAEVGIIVD